MNKVRKMVPSFDNFIFEILHHQSCKLHAKLYQTVTEFYSSLSEIL